MAAANKKPPISTKKKSSHNKKENKPASKNSETKRIATIILSFISFFVVVVAIGIHKVLTDPRPPVDKHNDHGDDDYTGAISPADYYNSGSSEVLPREYWAKPDPRVAFLLGQVCRVAFCHEGLQAVKRSFRATRRIEPGETLFEIPRKLQLWDLDALRDPFIQEHLFEATHKMSGNHLGNEAYLAAYLAMQINKANVDPSSFDYTLLAYFDVLPDLSEHKDHPVLIDHKVLEDDLLGPSLALATVKGYRDMILSEYEAFVFASPEFGKRVSKKEFYASRLNVLTRAINVGPPGRDEAMEGKFLSSELNKFDLLRDEIEAYKEMLGIDLMANGCIAMVPIADLFNHHPMNNVEFTPQSEETGKNSFVVRADNRNIEEGFEPMANYGSISDSQLYSRYGFVNGDGSAPIHIGINSHHTLLRLNISSQYDYLPNSGMTPKFKNFQAAPISRYLQFDDGHDDCIAGPATHPQEAELKRLKYKHLQKIANDLDRWTILIPARNPYSYPNHDIESPITVAVPQYIKHLLRSNLDFDGLIKTCRIMSVTLRDYDGKAIEILRENLDNDNFVLGPGGDGLEFLSKMCVGRWFTINLGTMERKRKLNAQTILVERLNVESYGSREWNAQHIRYGEMQATLAARTILQEIIEGKWMERLDSQEPTYIFRIDEPCPKEHLDYLLEEDDDVEVEGDESY